MLQILRRRLDECATAIAAADEWLSNRLRAAAIAAEPRRFAAAIAAADKWNCEAVLVAANASVACYGYFGGVLKNVRQRLRQRTSGCVILRQILRWRKS